MLEQGLKAWVTTCPATRSEYVLSYSNREIPKRGLIIAVVVGYSRTHMCVWWLTVLSPRLEPADPRRHDKPARNGLNYDEM